MSNLAIVDIEYAVSDLQARIKTALDSFGLQTVVHTKALHGVSPTPKEIHVLYKITDKEGRVLAGPGFDCATHEHGSAAGQVVGRHIGDLSAYLILGFTKGIGLWRLKGTQRWIVTDREMVIAEFSDDRKGTALACQTFSLVQVMGMDDKVESLFHSRPAPGA